MLNKDKQLKFPDGSTTEVTIENIGMEELEFGSEYIVRIKETIDGYDHFKPSDGLQKKLSDEGVKPGDIINITKVAPDEKYTYGYFTVSMVESSKVEMDKHKAEMDKYATGETKAVQPENKGAANFEKQFKVEDDKIGLHELKLRVETIEKQVASLLKAALPF